MFGVLGILNRFDLWYFHLMVCLSGCNPIMQFMGLQRVEHDLVIEQPHHNLREVCIHICIHICISIFIYIHIPHIFWCVESEEMFHMYTYTCVQWYMLFYILKYLNIYMYCYIYKYLFLCSLSYFSSLFFSCTFQEISWILTSSPFSESFSRLLSHFKKFLKLSFVLWLH